jgi:hypothetical protein
MPTGPGIVGPAIDLLPLVAVGLVAGGIIAIGVIVYARPARNTAIASLLVVGAVIAIGAVLVTHPAPTFGGMIGVPSAADFDSSSDFVLSVGPNQPFVAVVQVTNEGTLPIKILGVINRGLNQRPQTFPNWRTVTVAGNPLQPEFDPNDATPFEPFDLAPGAYVQMNVTGMTDGCASAEADSGLTSAIETIPLAYEVVGLHAETEIDILNKIVEPLQSDCALL